MKQLENQHTTNRRKFERITRHSQQWYAYTTQRCFQQCNKVIQHYLKFSKQRNREIEARLSRGMTRSFVFIIFSMNFTIIIVPKFEESKEYFGTISYIFKTNFSPRRTKNRGIYLESIIFKFFFNLIQHIPSILPKTEVI